MYERTRVNVKVEKSTLSQKKVITLTFTKDRIPSKFIDMHLMKKKCLKVCRYLWEIRRMDNMTFFRFGI